MVALGYKVKWVEDNLGVSRKALRGFEKAGLMPENKGNQYRDYDDDDIDRIWAIRVLQGMGYSIKEIVTMVNDDNFDFDSSLSKKVEELEEEKKKVERHLGYAKTIKFTGRFPSRPQKMGEITFGDFQKQALEGWNITDDPQAVEYQKLAETILSKSPEEWEYTDLGRMFSVLEDFITMDTDFLLSELILPKAIAKRIEYGASHPEIQLMVKMIYENQKTLNQFEDMSVKQFARFYSSSYLSGDISKLKARDLSEQEREFVAEAISVFGGYESYDALLEEEARYGR